MTQRVVHLLEVIEVEEQHRRRMFPTRNAGDGMLDAIQEERTIREAREFIVEGLVGQP